MLMLFATIGVIGCWVAVFAAIKWWEDLNAPSSDHSRVLTWEEKEALIRDTQEWIRKRHEEQP